MKTGLRQYLTLPLISSVLMVVVPLIATSFLSVHFVQNEEIYLGFTTFQWIAFACLGIFTQALALTPPTFCALVLGYFWGWETLPILFIINLLSILLINLIVRKLDHNTFVSLINSKPKAAQLLKSIKQDELKIITLTKLSPVLPFTFTNFVFALSGASLRNILLGGFLGMIPRTIVSVWTGTKAKEIRNLLENPNEGAFQQILVIALILISVFGLVYVINRAVSRVAD